MLNQKSTQLIFKDDKLELWRMLDSIHKIHGFNKSEIIINHLQKTVRNRNDLIPSGAQLELF